MNKRTHTHKRITSSNPPELSGRRKRRTLTGVRPSEEQAAYYEGELPSGDVGELLDVAEQIEVEDLELLAEIEGVQLIGPQTEPPEIENLELLDDIYEGQLPVSIAEGVVSDTEILDLLTDLELRAGETTNPSVASNEDDVYAPPIDPSVIPAPASDLADYDESHHGSLIVGDNAISTRVREALRVDSSTALYADAITIETSDALVILYGLVNDLIDKNNLVAVAKSVAGVRAVVDALRVRGMEARY